MEKRKLLQINKIINILFVISIISLLLLIVSSPILLIYIFAHSVYDSIPLYFLFIVFCLDIINIKMVNHTINIVNNIIYRINIILFLLIIICILIDPDIFNKRLSFIHSIYYFFMLIIFIFIHRKLK